MSSLSMISLFDGSAGFPLAASLCGIEPIACSEIEPYPIAVSHGHFPRMKHLGDVSQVHGYDLEPVDIITFGSPCQDMSIAGKRAGIKHEANGDEETTRSGLFMEAVRIIKEMRSATHGVYPRFAIWENVPGAFSSNGGEDFRIVLEEMCHITEPTAVIPPVPRGGWSYHDCWFGFDWSIAYRVFDAQYWGVPQRRRRIYLVADFRGHSAGEILFKREGLRRDSEPSQKTREETAGAAGKGVAGSDCPYTMKIRSGCDGGGKGPIIKKDMSATLATNNDQYVFQPVAYGISSFDSNAMKSPNPTSGIYEAKTSRTLDLNGGNPTCNQGGIAVVSCGFKPFAGSAAGTIGWEQEKAPTLLAGMEPGVAIAFEPGIAARDGGDSRFSGGVAGTLRANMGDNQTAVCYDARGNGDGQTVPTLTGDHQNRVTDYTAVYCMDVGFFNSQYNLSPTLLSRQYKDPHLVCTDRKRNYIVRRLTPTECARLQGFPDRWGDIPHKESLTDDEYAFWLKVRQTYDAVNGRAAKEYKREAMLKWYNGLHTDSAEYKMWGNGICLNNALYIMQGIQEEMEGPMMIKPTEPIYRCEYCGAGIFSGEEYYEIDGEIYCPDCMNQNYRNYAPEDIDLDED